MTVYLVVLGEFAVLILFYGQQSQGMAMIWALLIDAAVVILLKVC